MPNKQRHRKNTSRDVKKNHIHHSRHQELVPTIRTHPQLESGTGKGEPFQPTKTKLDLPTVSALDLLGSSSTYQPDYPRT